MCPAASVAPDSSWKTWRSSRTRGRTKVSASDLVDMACTLRAVHVEVIRSRLLLMLGDDVCIKPVDVQQKSTTKHIQWYTSNSYF